MAHVPTRSEAPPAGADAAGPRPDLRGFRLGLAALISRPQEQILARRVPGLVGGFAGGLVVGVALLLAGVPETIAVLAAAGANLVLSLWLPSILIAPADRRLRRVVNRLTEASYADWRRAYGKVPIPRTEEQQLLWIAAQPDASTNPDAIAIEASFLLAFGRYEAARERIERLPDDTPIRRFDRAVCLATIEFESGAGPGDLGATRVAADAVSGGRQKSTIASLALEEANRAMIRGEDWDPPIARAVATVGWPIGFGILMTIWAARKVMPFLLVSELLLGTVLYLVVRPLV